MRGFRGGWWVVKSVFAYSKRLRSSCARAPRTHAHHLRGREVLGFHLGAFSSETVVGRARFHSRGATKSRVHDFRSCFRSPVGRRRHREGAATLPSARPREKGKVEAENPPDRGDAVRRIPAERSGGNHPGALLKPPRTRLRIRARIVFRRIYHIS